MNVRVIEALDKLWANRAELVAPTQTVRRMSIEEAKARVAQARPRKQVTHCQNRYEGGGICAAETRNASGLCTGCETEWRERYGFVPTYEATI